ncbi:MAG TPA: hypothetical protein PLQ36_01775, partial [Candidatus Gracilibacteria bacterium]|nr:hypothetical protein [Candidatus Gracilibacteria bacterium]
PTDSQIWRYEKKRDTYSGASAWLNTSYDLKDAIDMAIDGSIYVLKKGGGVNLFYRNQEEPISIQGGDSSLLTQATRVYVRPNMKNVYFLNPTRKSVIVYKIVNKGLEYKREYVFETNDMLTDLSVDQNEQRLIVSDQNKIYQITM